MYLKKARATYVETSSQNNDAGVCVDWVHNLRYRTMPGQVVQLAKTDLKALVVSQSQNDWGWKKPKLNPLKCRYFDEMCTAPNGIKKKFTIQRSACWKRDHSKLFRVLRLLQYFLCNITHYFEEFFSFAPSHISRP